MSAIACAAPLAILALGTGLLQVTLSGWGLVRHRWVTVKLAGTSGEPFTTAQRLPPTIVPAAATAPLILNATLGVLKPGRTRHGVASSRR